MNSRTDTKRSLQEVWNNTSFNFYLMIQLVRAEALVDISASTGSVFAFDAPKNGKLLLNQSWLRFEEAAGTQTSAAGVASIEVGGTECATYTSTKSEAIGDTSVWTQDSTVGDDQAVYFSQGDVIDVKLKTQASGGTVTGTIRAYLAIQIDAN